MENIIKVDSPIYRNEKQDELIIKINNVAIDATAEIIIKFPDFHSILHQSSKTSLDFFFISSIIYGVDRFIERHRYSTDGWSRVINITIPVYEIEKWGIVKIELENLLSFLTGDYWTISFIENTYCLNDNNGENDGFFDNYKQVNLFSGGLDSLIGAINFLAENENDKLILVSHFDFQMKGPETDQNILFENFPDEYKSRIKKIQPCKVSLINSNVQKEKTFRSRSILFLGIAVVIADLKKTPIVVPENGSVSLNFPLSPSRRGACSTRTTHPTFIDMLISMLLKLDLISDIKNPFEFKTKGEMVDDCKNIQLLTQIINLSNSCGKRGHVVNRTNRETTHCGVCMPCTYRKASLLNTTDLSTYGDDLNKPFVGKHQTPFLTSKQGQDINAMLDFLGKEFTKIEIRQELIVGGVKNLLKLNDYVELVIRTRAELKKLVDSTCTVSERRIKAGL